MKREDDLPSQSPGTLLAKGQLADEDIAVSNRLPAIIADVLFPDDDSHRSLPEIGFGSRAAFYP
jgi:hypothetical protein